MERDSTRHGIPEVPTRLFRSLEPPSGGERKDLVPGTFGHRDDCGCRAAQRVAIKLGNIQFVVNLGVRVEIAWATARG